MRDWRLLAAGVLTAGGLVVFVATLAHATLFAPEQEAAAPNLAAQAPARIAARGDLPAQLVIPSLGISANVQYVGIAKSGAMGVPNNFTDVAWYKYGTIPGFRGSAVIDGHVDNAISLPGVFKHLAEIAPGADIYVVTASSTRVHFVVTDVESYMTGQVPLQRVFSQSDGAYLNLITCDGTWIQGERSYDHRLVVYAKLAA